MRQVVIAGAAGKMGQQAVKAVSNSPDFTLVGALTCKSGLGEDAGTYAGDTPAGIILGNHLPALLDGLPDPPHTVFVDLTHGENAYHNAITVLEKRIPLVIGATGFTETQVNHLRELSQQHTCGVILAPNFALGAILMMKFAQEACRYFETAEIIEMHHERKKDAPSGTALKTAQLMAQGHQPVEPVGPRVAARGEWVQGIPIHSVRLPGLVAHQEVILGATGEILTLRHDTMSREAFMPGLLLCIRKVPELTTLVYGLEHLL